MEYMPQFETEVPDPLREDLPKLLTPGGMRAPAIRILLLIFITEYALERSPVQIESHDIGRRERSLRQGCVEQLVDHRSTGGTDLRRELGRRMGGDDDPCVWPDGRKREIREVKECSTRSRFGMARLLVWGLRQAGLDSLHIEEIVVFAPHHIAKPCQIRHNSSVAILAVKTHDSLTQGKRLGLHRGADRLPQLSSVIAIACARCP
jgi:hypothetical protein